jgi:hypothetical protein
MGEPPSNPRVRTPIGDGALDASTELDIVRIEQARIFIGAGHHQAAIVMQYAP